MAGIIGVQIGKIILNILVTVSAGLAACCIPKTPQETHDREIEEHIRIEEEGRVTEIDIRVPVGYERQIDD